MREVDVLASAGGGINSAGEEGTLRELRLECVPGGRLEYVPVATNGAPVSSLWVSGKDDTGARHHSTRPES